MSPFLVRESVFHLCRLMTEYSCVVGVEDWFCLRKLHTNITSSVVIHACNWQANTITDKQPICLFVSLFLWSWQREKLDVLPDMKFMPCMNWYLLFREWLHGLSDCYIVNRADTMLPALYFCRADSQIRTQWLCCIYKDRNVNVICYAAVLLSLLILSDADCEKITAVLLKSRTGEFDLESILFLKLRGLGKI